MITTTIDAPVDEISRFLTSVEREQLPFATALALTRSAVAADKALRKVRGAVFDRPNPWTRNAGAFVKAATKANLRASVEFSEGGAAGRSAFSYLRHQIDGGARGHKGFERLLIARGIMLPSEYAVPARGVQLDRYGNISPGVMARIMSQLKAFQEVGFDANATRSARSRAGRRNNAFFAADGEGALRRGVWLRKGADISPVLIFVRKAPTYEPRYRHGAQAQRLIQQGFAAEFSNALDFAVRTRRR